MTIGIEVWVTRSRAGVRKKVTEAKFVFVAVDEAWPKEAHAPGVMPE